MRRRDRGRWPSVLEVEDWSVAGLAAAVGRYPVDIGEFVDEELVLGDGAPLGRLDTPRFSTWGEAEQDAAITAVLSMLMARHDVLVDDAGGEVEFVGALVPLLRLREAATRRMVLTPELSEDDAGYVVLETIGGVGPFATCRVVDFIDGVHIVVLMRVLDAVSFALEVLEVATVKELLPGVGKVDLESIAVQRAARSEDLDPSPLALERDADRALAVMVADVGTDPPPEWGTVTRGPEGIHLARGFETTAGQEFTVAELAPQELLVVLASALDG